MNKTPDTTILKCIGLMSGTSMDGIDAAILETDGINYAKNLGARSKTYAKEFQIILRSAEYAVKEFKGDVSRASESYNLKLIEYLKKHFDNVAVMSKLLSKYIHNDEDKKIEFDDVVDHSTRLHAQLVQELIDASELSNDDIDLIGYHGQSLFHKPIDGITVQIGNAMLLATITDVPVVNEFRKNDLLNGGQGAPLAPLYHKAMAIAKGYASAAIVNCGGIANVTFITGNGDEDIVGFDTGPGNVLIDRYIRLKTFNKEFMDRDGKYGLQGKVSQSLINELYAQSIIKDGVNYFAENPPKSLDPSDIKLIPNLLDLSFNDACATLEAFTAFTIAESVKFLNDKPPCIWILAGGGWNNPVILNKLKEYLIAKIPDVKVFHADEIGWNNVSMEAEIFAYLAVRRLKKLPISHPKTTNVKPGTLSGELNLVPNKKVTDRLNKFFK